MPRAPRYQTLAAQLIDDITSGVHPIGSRLPTELDLCRTYKVSRHTARDALRRLLDAGLVERRRGAGTTVIAAQPRPAFAQRLGGMPDILQYARDARLTIQTLERRRIDDATAKALQLALGSSWIVIEGVRAAGPGQPPVALTRILIEPSFKLTRARIAAWDGALSELIEAEHGVRVAQIDQSISASVLDSAQAAALGEPSGAPVLRTVRRYLDAAGKLIVVSDSLHPADRFVYAMTISRDGSA